MQTSLEKQLDNFPNQNGSLEQMLIVDPRMYREGMIFRCTTNNKIYIVSLKFPTTKSQSIKNIRSGNFVWIELVYSEEKQDYIRGVDQLSHVKNINYPDNEIRDEQDLIVALCNKLDISSLEQKQFYKSLFSSETNIVEAIETFVEPMVFSPQFKTGQNKNWINEVLNCVFESLFFNWIQV